MSNISEPEIIVKLTKEVTGLAKELRAAQKQIHTLENLLIRVTGAESLEQAVTCAAETPE